jgi:NAD-dependent deacetylase sirtuin 2
MYDTLRPELLTATPDRQEWMRQDPTAVVMWDMFKTNAFPYLEVRRPFILGTRDQTWKATIAHRFMELLHTKTHKLTRVYTQNIDGLHKQCTELPTETVVPVHGTISQVGCEGCGADMEFDLFCEHLQTNIKDIYATNDTAPAQSTPIKCPTCDRALVKPKTVLFGRSLPEQFFVRANEDLPHADLLIIAGTSLAVSPANSLAYRVPDSTIRVVVNSEPVGQELGIDYDDSSGRDFFAQGDSDSVFLELIRELGWTEDLIAKKDLLPTKSQALLGA